MQNKALYLLAQFDDETQDILSSYYETLQHHGLIGKQTKNIPYHFTLGCKDINCEKQLINQMSEICTQTEIIDICLAHPGLFGLNVLFIAPNMNFELLKLQHRFFENCGYGCHLWTPHATILLDDQENILKALPIVSENFKPFRAQIISIGLYEFFPTRCIKEFKLV